MRKLSDRSHDYRIAFTKIGYWRDRGDIDDFKIIFYLQSKRKKK